MPGMWRNCNLVRLEHLHVCGNSIMNDWHDVSQFSDVGLRRRVSVFMMDGDRPEKFRVVDAGGPARAVQYTYRYCVCVFRVLEKSYWRRFQNDLAHLLI